MSGAGTLADHLEGYARFGHRRALVRRGRYRSEAWSYRRLVRAAAAFHARLAAAGVRPGDRVLIRGPASPAWVAGFLGCVRAGAVAVPLDEAAGDALSDRVRAQAGCRLAMLPAADGWQPGIPRLDLDDPEAPAGEAPPPHRARPSDLLQLVFTSGTTGDPRGVMITHGNVLAYLAPIEAGYRRRRLWIDPLLPVSVLVLPPLSHLFGQAVGIFLPLRFGCTAVFQEAFDPASLRRTLRQERIWIAAVVPRVLDLLAGDLRRQAALRGWDLDRLVARAPERGLARRVWAARRVQRWLGWRFRGFVVGGAPLDEPLESLWRGLGFLLIQGYGLTETAPVVTLTDPFHPRPGAVGRPLAGQEIRLAPDGEILVRGGNVMAGYWNDPEATARALDAEGFLHTGDLGTRDADGSLRIVGRKKEMIVTSEGLNVHPEDVERALRALAGVRDAVALGQPGIGGETVRAVLLLDSTAPAVDDLVAAANESLAPHQRIRSAARWEGADFPRTPTGKVRRREVAAAASARAASAPAAADPVLRILERAGAEPGRLAGGSRLSDLGLSSLDLVEVGAALEHELGRSVADEELRGDTSIDDLRRLASGGGEAATATPEVPVPGWVRRGPVRVLRRVVRDALVLPGLSLWTPMEVEGLEHLRPLEPPLLFAPNHASSLDLPILCRALPRRFRVRTAPAITAEYFRDWWGASRPSLRSVVRGLQYRLAAALFQAFLLPQRQGFREALRHAGEMADAGQCPVVFPEGSRSAAGLLPFRPGIGLMATHLRIPVVPVHLRGTGDVLPRDHWWPRRAPVRVRFGAPLRFSPGSDPQRATRDIERAVHELAR